MQKSTVAHPWHQGAGWSWYVGACSTWSSSAADIDKYEAMWESLDLMKDECMELLSKVLRGSFAAKKREKNPIYTLQK